MNIDMERWIVASEPVVVWKRRSESGLWQVWVLFVNNEPAEAWSWPSLQRLPLTESENGGIKHGEAPAGGVYIVTVAQGVCWVLAACQESVQLNSGMTPVNRPSIILKSSHLQA